MTTTIEMIIEDGQTTPGKFISCKTVWDCDDVDEEVGNAIATVLEGTQIVRQISALAHAMMLLGSDVVIGREEEEFLKAAYDVISFWEKHDNDINERAANLGDV